MKNLKEQSIKLEVKISDLGDMLKMISLVYPKIKDSENLAILVSKNFEVICTKEDIEGYYKQLIQTEDFELESRKQEYGINY